MCFNTSGELLKALTVLDGLERLELLLCQDRESRFGCEPGMWSAGDQQCENV